MPSPTPSPSETTQTGGGTGPDARNSGSAVLQPASNLQMGWAFSADKSSVTMTMSMDTLAWMAIGVSPRSAMIGTLAVIVKGDGGSGCTIDQYRVTTLTASGMQQDGSGFTAASASCTVTGNTVSAVFTRAVTNGDYSLSLTGNTPMAWAVGFELQAFDGHQAEGVTNVNMATGAVSAAGRKPLHVAHGAINFVAWGILLPLGVLLARFTKHIPVKAGPPLWFNSHRMLQTTGLFFTILALFIAVVMVERDGKPHFDNVHAQIGLVVTLLGVLQPLNALIRPAPKPPTPKRVVWEVVHKGVGYATIIIGVAAIITGLDAIQPAAATITLILYSDYVAAFGTAFLIFEWLRRHRTAAPAPAPAAPAVAVPAPPPRSQPGAPTGAVAVEMNNLSMSTPPTVPTDSVNPLMALGLGAGEAKARPPPPSGGAAPGPALPVGSPWAQPRTGKGPAGH